MSSWSDVEGDLRDYLRADAAVKALLGNRVFFGIPAKVKFPLATVTRISGGQDPGETPIDRPVMRVDVWGAPRDKEGAYLAAAAVRDALGRIRRITKGSTHFFGAQVIGVIFYPDPATDQPRYSLTVDVTARAVTAA